MNRPNFALCALCASCALFVFLFAPSTWAAERIVSFHSKITILADGDLDVIETIEVDAEGDQIRRGIYRDFPTKYEDASGNHRSVTFEVQGVRRDGRPEPYKEESQGNGVRIYIGKGDVFLEPGRYSYEISYRTGRQLGFFDKHDELYWNVTGNGWNFPIDRASAIVHLPRKVPADALDLAGYTGPSGSRAADYTSRIASAGIEFETTAPLGVREGLTIVVGFPKGIVSEPTEAEELLYFVLDNVALIALSFALVGSVLWLFVSWARVGRDPEPGVLYARYAPPKGYSPASARFIRQMGYDTTTFTAAVLHLAVKGHLRIAQDSTDEYRLDKLTSQEPLAPGETVLMQGLFKKGTTLSIRDKNHARLSSTQAMHESALEQDYEDIYFKKNAEYLLPSVLVSVLAFALGLFSDTFTIGAGVVSGLILVVHVVFVFLLRTPTARGRQLLDELEGFRLYLQVAEGEDLKVMPVKTPQLYEQYLPYAVALEVENAWEKQFADVFRTYEQKTGRAYSPAWYSGKSSTPRGLTSAVGAGFASAISSASTPPGSSSGGGGGGSSGGGGGGGGGGGW